MFKNKIAISLVASSILVTSVFSADILDSVVVTAKTNTSIMDTAGSVSIITAEDIKKVNATSIKDVLINVPGINLGVNDSSIGGRQTISIRGTSSNKVLILIDGKKVSASDDQIGHSNFQYNWVPMNSIEKIEVIKGPMSSIYGSQAIGGVVNIITKKSDKKFYGELDLKGGVSSDDGGDVKDISFSIGGKVTDKLKLSLTAEKRNLETAVIENNKPESKIEGSDIVNVGLNVSYEIDDTQQIDATIQKGKEVREYTQYSALSKTFSKYDKYYDIDKLHYSLAYSKQFEDIALDIGYYSTQSDSHVQRFKYTHELETNVFNTELTIDKFENNFIVIGVENRDEKYVKRYDSSIKKGFAGDINNKSIFIQDEIDIHQKVLLTFGARYDKHEKFGGEFSPKLNVVYKLSENSRLKAGYGEGFKAPTVTQNSSSYQFSGRHIFNGNDDLTPEKSKSFELGYEYYGDDDTFKSTLFYTKIDDLIGSKQTGSMGPRKIYLYSNIDKATMKGVELEYNHNFTSFTSVNIGYSYLKTEDVETGEELTLKPKQKINFNVSTRLPYDISTTLRVNYIGSQVSGDDKYGGFTTAGVQFSKDVIKNFNVRLGVDNIADKNLDSNPYDIKGRLIYMGLNYKF